MGARTVARALATGLLVLVLAGCALDGKISNGLRAAVGATTSATTTAAPSTPPPIAFEMTCASGSPQSSPDFGHRITATRPYTVAIDYGDGNHYSNDDQYLDAVFTHAYQAPGTYTVKATLSDATGRAVTATCVYSWTAPSAAAAAVATTTAPKPTRAPGPFVRSFATCPLEGTTGVTADGSLLECATTPNDPQLRWRAP